MIIIYTCLGLKSGGGGGGSEVAEEVEQVMSIT